MALEASTSFFIYKFIFYIILQKFIKLYIILFIDLIFGCAGSLWLRRLFSGCREWGLLSSCSVRASAYGGFSHCRARAVGRTGFSNCRTWAQLLHSMWDLPGSGIKPVSPALVGRLLSTAPSGKSSTSLLSSGCYLCLECPASPPSTNMAFKIPLCFQKSDQMSTLPLLWFLFVFFGLKGPHSCEFSKGLN